MSKIFHVIPLFGKRKHTAKQSCECKPNETPGRKSMGRWFIHNSGVKTSGKWGIKQEGDKS